MYVEAFAISVAAVAISIALYHQFRTSKKVKDKDLQIQLLHDGNVRLIIANHNHFWLTLDGQRAPASKEMERFLASLQQHLPMLRRLPGDQAVENAAIEELHAEFYSVTAYLFMQKHQIESEANRRIFGESEQRYDEAFFRKLCQYAHEGIAGVIMKEGEVNHLLRPSGQLDLAHLLRPTTNYDTKTELLLQPTNNDHSGI